MCLCHGYHKRLENAVSGCTVQKKQTHHGLLYSNQSETDEIQSKQSFQRA